MLKKSNFILFVFFGIIKSEKMGFDILDREEKFLDQNINPWFHGSFAFFWRNQVRKKRFLIFWIKKNDF